MRIIIDSTAPILAALRESRICIDPRCRGELVRIFENLAVRRWYQRADGLTVDEIGEMLVDRGFIDCSPTEREVLELLEALFVTPSAKRSHDGSASAIAADEYAVEVRRKTRLRLFECSTCGSKIRRASDCEDTFHRHVDPDTDAEFFAPYILKSPILRSAQNVPF